MGLKRVIRKNGFYILLATPLVVYLSGFTLGPVVYTVFLSFQEKLTLNFPTLANYFHVIRHFQFREAFFNTMAITFLSLTFELIAGLFLAILLTKKFIGKGALRAIALLPLGVPTIVAAANMRYIFDTQGYFNEFLYRLNLINIPVDWTGGGIKTLLCVALSDAWKVTPLIMLILIAGLESIPSQLYEAARVDGAGAWHMFKKITLPLLKPFITIAVIVRGIDAFRLFELPLILAGQKTPVMSTYTYMEYFQYDNPYTSASSAVLLTLMIVISAGVYLKAVGREETVYG